MAQFVSGIICIDGRALQAMLRYFMERNLYMDVIASEPGVNKLLSNGYDTRLIKSIEKRLNISYNVHGSRKLYMGAHADCFANPATKEVQKQHLLGSDREVEKILQRLRLQMEIQHLWTEPPWETAIEF